MQDRSKRSGFLSEVEESQLRVAILRRFLEFLPHFLLSIHTGMRMGEQYGLRWNQVDFMRRELHLLRTKIGDPRTIPLNAIALGALQELRGPKDPLLTVPVFPSARTGDALQGSRGWFATALEEAKVADHTWHCNRHTSASRLVMAGVDLRTVAELLGHRKLQMVMRYADLSPEDQASGVDHLVKFRGQNGHQNGLQSVSRKGTQTSLNKKSLKTK